MNCVEGSQRREPAGPRYDVVVQRDESQRIQHLIGRGDARMGGALDGQTYLDRGYERRHWVRPLCMSAGKGGRLLFGDCQLHKRRSVEVDGLGHSDAVFAQLVENLLARPSWRRREGLRKRRSRPLRGNDLSLGHEPIPPVHLLTRGREHSHAPTASSNAQRLPRFDAAKIDAEVLPKLPHAHA